MPLRIQLKIPSAMSKNIAVELVKNIAGKKSRRDEKIRKGDFLLSLVRKNP